MKYFIVQFLFSFKNDVVGNYYYNWRKNSLSLGETSCTAYLDDISVKCCMNAHVSCVLHVQILPQLTQFRFGADIRVYKDMVPKPCQNRQKNQTISKKANIE